MDKLDIQQKTNEHLGKLFYLKYYNEKITPDLFLSIIKKNIKK